MCNRALDRSQVCPDAALAFELLAYDIGIAWVLPATLGQPLGLQVKPVGPLGSWY
jgi:hypothetical protein